MLVVVLVCSVLASEHVGGGTCLLPRTDVHQKPLCWWVGHIILFRLKSPTMKARLIPDTSEL